MTLPRTPKKIKIRFKLSDPTKCKTREDPVKHIMHRNTNNHPPSLTSTCQPLIHPSSGIQWHFFTIKNPDGFPSFFAQTHQKRKNGAKCSLFTRECSSTSRPHSLPTPPPFSLNRRPPRLPRRPQKKHTFLRGSAIRKAPAGSTRQVAQRLRLTRRSHRRSTLLNSTTL